MATVTPLSIEAYTDEEFSSVAKTYKLIVNPVSMKQEYSIETVNQRAIGSLDSSTFASVPAQTISFDTLFDATGVLKNKSQDVGQDIKALQAVILDYDGAVHQPKYLKLVWGGASKSFAFTCRLQKMNIDYQYFTPDGVPLRCMVSLSFKEFKSQKTISKEKGNQSPDVSHSRVVQQGDTLPLLCKKIYGNDAFYLEVAKANQLSSFRKLEIGSVLYFPPIKK
jgi:nucleoid-associated protein YgaU